MLIAQIDDYMNGERDDLPEELTASIETQPGKSLCPFFAKTGSCKYKSECSRYEFISHILHKIWYTVCFISSKFDIRIQPM